jgi:hypothetical protein
MKKKLALIALSSFIIIFALWPSFKNDYTGYCNDTFPFDSDGATNGTTEDCASAQTLDKPAGGFKFLIMASTNNHISSPESDDISMYWVNNEGYVYPVQALVGAGVLSIIFVLTTYLVMHHKQSKKAIKR